MFKLKTLKKWFTMIELLFVVIITGVVMWIIAYNVKKPKIMSKDVNWQELTYLVTLKSEINQLWEFSFDEIFNTEYDWTNHPALKPIISECSITAEELKSHRNQFQKNILAALFWPENLQWDKKVESIVTTLQKLNSVWKLLFIYWDKEDDSKNYINYDTDDQKLAADNVSRYYYIVAVLSTENNDAILTMKWDDWKKYYVNLALLDSNWEVIDGTQKATMTQLRWLFWKNADARWVKRITEVNDKLKAAINNVLGTTCKYKEPVAWLSTN